MLNYCALQEERKKFYVRLKMAVKKLGDLTVEEATKELKKRGLDVNGDRNMLIARLRKALTEQRKPQTASVPTGSNQTEKTQPSPTKTQPSPTKTQPSPTTATTVDKAAAAPVAIAETVSQVPAASSATEKKEEDEEEKPPKAEVEPSAAVVQPQLEVKEKEDDGEKPAEKKVDEEKEKVADDPPLDLLADESQNDLDDDIVCVSITPGKGFRKSEAGGTPKKQAAVAQKDSPEKKTTTTPSKDSNIASASAGTSEQDGSKTDLSLWVSGLDSSSRAADLKTLFSKHGKVTGAKVVASAKTPDSKCFGIVTMATPDDVEKCIIALDGSSLHGKDITVELYSGHRKTVEKAMMTPTATLWITGIAPETKAPELKKLFVPHGRVVAATIVMNASGGGTARRCGLVKMSSCEEADLCIQKVNKMTLNDRVITVERAKSNRLPVAKTAGKTVSRRPPSLMSQKLAGSNKPSGSKPLSLLDPLLSVKGNMSKSTVRPRGIDRGRTRRGGQIGMRMGLGRRGSSSMAPPLGRMRYEREHVMMRIQHEQAVKAKEAELVRVLALEFDRQKQKEEAERLAYEREQLEVERMRLDRERMEAERLRVQLEQERRQNEREQLERERARNQMLRNEQRMSMKRAAEQDESYWDYMMKKGRSSSPSSSGQNLGRGPNMYENTNQRLQQMAHGAERRLNESRMKNSMASGSSSSMGGGRQMQGSSMYHRQSSGMESSGESGSKSEWKSLFNMSSGGSGNNGGEQSQWKSLSSSSLGRNYQNDDYSFSSGGSSSFRGRPYPSNNSGFGGGGGMKSQYGSGFKGGRGGGGAGGGGGGAHNRWR